MLRMVTTLGCRNLTPNGDSLPGCLLWQRFFNRIWPPQLQRKSLLFARTGRCPRLCSAAEVLMCQGLIPIGGITPA
jgi:hypothetical protein